MKSIFLLTIRQQNVTDKRTGSGRHYECSEMMSKIAYKFIHVFNNGGSFQSRCISHCITRRCSVQLLFSLSYRSMFLLNQPLISCRNPYLFFPSVLSFFSFSFYKCTRVQFARGSPNEMAINFNSELVQVAL